MVADRVTAMPLEVKVFSNEEGTPTFDEAGLLGLAIDDPREEPRGGPFGLVEPVGLGDGVPLGHVESEGPGGGLLGLVDMEGPD